MKSRLGVAVVASSPSSWPPARAPGRHRRRPSQRSRLGGPGAPPPRRRPAAALTIFGAASLKGALDQGQDGLRGGEPGHDADDLDRLVVRSRDPDRAGRAGRRLPVGRHDQPEEARRQGARRRRRRHVRRQQADDRRADRQPGGHHLARRTSPSPASRSSPPATRCRSRSTRRSSSATWPSRRATRPTSSPPTPRTSRPRRTTSRRSSPRSSSARATPGIVYVTDAKASDKVKTIDVPDAANVPADL